MFYNERNGFAIAPIAKYFLSRTPELPESSRACVSRFPSSAETGFYFSHIYSLEYPHEPVLRGKQEKRLVNPGKTAKMEKILRAQREMLRQGLRVFHDLFGYAFRCSAVLEMRQAISRKN